MDAAFEVDETSITLMCCMYLLYRNSLQANERIVHRSMVVGPPGSFNFLALPADVSAHSRYLH